VRVRIVVEMAPALLAGILGAHVVEIGFMAALQWKVATVKTKLEERTEAVPS
jgi:hypothetical protein